MMFIRIAESLRDGVWMEKAGSSSSEVINNKENIDSNNVEMPKLGMEPMQMKRRKKGIGYNLRKSLAWDRAFFTDEGILDPFDLTLITGIDANTCRGGLLTIREEGSSSFFSDARCTDESNDMEASKEAPLEELHDKIHTTKGKSEKTDCSMRNHDSSLNRKVTNKVLTSNRTNRGGSKLGGCSEPLAASSLKRPANSHTLKAAKKGSKLPKLPISKPGPCFYANTKGSISASHLRHNPISKPTTKVEKNSGLKSSLQNEHCSQSKAKPGSGNLHLPVKEPTQKTAKNLTHSSKAASLIRSELVQPVQVDRANIRSELVQDSFQICKVLDESASLAAKHLAQHAAANSNNSLPEAATRLTSSASCHIQRASKGLMISDVLHRCESQERTAELARPSGLRLPSSSLRLFDERTASVSGSMQQKKNKQYMGYERKNTELGSPVRPPMNSNDITECCAPSTQLSPSPNYTLNTNIKGVTDSITHQMLVTKSVLSASEQHKKILGPAEVAVACKRDEEFKVSHSIEQLTKNEGTCRQLMSEGRVPETIYKSVLYNKEHGLHSCTAFSMSTSVQSIQQQEENISIGFNDLAQILWEQTDTEKSDVASPKVKPVFHLATANRVFMESHEQDEVGKRDIDVGTTKCVAPGIEIHSFVPRHGQENDVSKVTDGKCSLTEEDNSSCSRTMDITFRNSHSLEDEADVMEFKSIGTSCISFQNLNAEQKNDDVHDADAFPITATTSFTITAAAATTPCVRDPYAEEGNGICINQATSIRGKVQLHDSPVRDTLTQLLNDNSSAGGFHIESTTNNKKTFQLPVTLLLDDNPLSTEGFNFIPTTSTKNKSLLQDTCAANGSMECSEATTCVSVLLDSQVTCSDVTDTNDHLFQEKGVSSAILMEVSGQKQDGVDVDLIPRDDGPSIDDQNQLSGISHLIPHIDIISETASLGADTLDKRESALQGAQYTSTYPQSLEKERVDIAAPTVEAQHKISEKNHKNQEIGLIVAEKSQESCGIISETKPAVHVSTDGLKTHCQFQSENEVFEGCGPISNISKTNVEDGQLQLLDGDALVQSCSSLTSEVPHHFIENADHGGILGKHAEFSNTGIKLKQVSQSNEYLHQQQESVSKVVWNVVEGSDNYECDARTSNSTIVDITPPIVEVVGKSDRQLCVYGTVGSTVIDSPEFYEKHNDWQPTECTDLALNFVSELEPSVKDKTFRKSSTCMEYCSAGKKPCSFQTDSMLQEKTTLFLDDQVLMNNRLLSTEKISDRVVDPELNTNASAQNLNTVQVNEDDQPQGFVGIMSLVETYDDFKNEQSNLSLSVSQQLTTGMKTTSTPESCCLIGGEDESLLTKTTCLIGHEGSEMSIGMQVDATPIVGDIQLESDNLKDRKDATMLMKRSNSIKWQDNSLVIHPPNAVPFSDEWLAAFEAAGEEILTMKCGAVQHSPQDKSLPEPSPWSPVKRKANQIGPYDCTKYINVMPSNSQLSDQ
ncbi:hypothetical protein R6Q57_005881 [Mikania cordata]